MEAMTLTSSTAADREFLFEVYASSRADEMALIQWSAQEKEVFLRQQFELQDRHYRAHYPSARFQLVRHEERNIGRLYTHETEREIRVMDIALLPPWRRRGIGGSLLREILARAADSARIVTLHVEHQNPARRLYNRLGFRTVADVGVYLRLEWSQNADGDAAALGEPVR
jgi:ribosomal protein S18 acetylase RimI-like enzyme